jgi:hypothetical protein
MRKILPLLSVSILVAMAFVMSCSNENANPDKCDGSLSLAIDPLQNPTSCTSNNGSISVTASGGNEPYKYSLNGGPKQTSAIFSGLSAGVYSVAVFDVNGCDDEVTSIELNSPDTDLNLSPTTTADNSCSINNGEISLVGSGGTGGYQYKLNSQAYSATSSFSGLAPGTYSVSVKDSEGCEKTISVQVLRGNTGTTYTAAIKSIIDTNCATSSGCHGAGASGKPEFNTFSKVSTNASSIFSRANAGTMPPSGKINQNLIDQIACWIADGKPQ